METTYSHGGELFLVLDPSVVLSALEVKGAGVPFPMDQGKKGGLEEMP